MQVVANGQPIPFELNDEKNLREIIQTLLILTNQANKLIMSCIVNGEKISLLERDKYAQMLISDIKTIEIVVENKESRVVESLDEICRLFPMLVQQFSEVANFLITGQKHKALQLFSRTLGQWRQMVNFLRVVEASYKLNFSELVVNGKRIEESNTQLFTLLNEVKKAIENEDLVSMGDLIEYELKTKLEEQQSIVKALQDIVHKETDRIAQQLL